MRGIEIISNISNKELQYGKRQHNDQLVTQLLLFLVHGCGTLDDTYINPFTTRGGTKCPRRRLFDAVSSTEKIQS